MNDMSNRPRRILIVQGHPDPAPERLCRALGEAYAAGARAAGHQVESIDLARLDIPFLRGAEDFSQGNMPDSLADASSAMREADHLVLIFPLWLGTMPALVKAFMEQVMRPGTAFTYRKRGFPEKLLKGKSARVVVTMGMPAMLYRLWYGAHGVRALERNILAFVGYAPVRTSLLGMVPDRKTARSSRWIEDMGRLGRGAR